MAGKIERNPAKVAEALHKAHGLVSDAANILGCSVKPIYALIKNNPMVAEAAKEADAAMKDVAEGKLYKAIQNGESWAIMFYLGRKGKDRGYSERTELSGADGKAMPIGYFIAKGAAERGLSV